MPRLYRNPDAIWREEDMSKELVEKGIETGEDVSEIGTSVILVHGKLHALNMLGTEVWKLCDGKTMDEIVSELEKRFEVDSETLRKDISLFLQEMEELGLIYEE